MLMPPNNKRELQPNTRLYSDGALRAAPAFPFGDGVGVGPALASEDAVTRLRTALDMLVTTAASTVTAQGFPPSAFAVADSQELFDNLPSKSSRPPHCGQWPARPARSGSSRVMLMLKNSVPLSGMRDWQGPEEPDHPRVNISALSELFG